MPAVPSSSAAASAHAQADAGEDDAGELLGRAGMVAVRVADLACPGRGPGTGGRPALVTHGAGRIATGDLVAFCKPVAVARAVVRRDGRVQAAGHPADHARLGVAEERLDELTGTPGVIDEVAATVVLKGKVKGAARRAMTCALAIRFTLLMTLMPADADYAEVMAALLGDLAAGAVAAAVPAADRDGRLAPGGRRSARAAGASCGTGCWPAIDAEHREHDYRAVTVGDLDACSIDGSLTRVPDTPANRQAFGSAGTADDSSPYPQLRELRLLARLHPRRPGRDLRPVRRRGRRRPGQGRGRAGAAGQGAEGLPARVHPGRLWIMDRNFPGVPRIKRMLATGTHVLIRVKDGITLNRAGDFLPDGSYLADHRPAAASR